MLSIDNLEKLVSPVLEQLGLVFHGLDLKREGKELILKITVDRSDKAEGGVTVDDLTNANREVGAILDLEDPIEEHYRLVVESPGIERELSTWRHFVFAVGEKMHIVTRGVNASHYDGELIATDEETKSLTLLCNNERKELAYTDIKSAKTLFVWLNENKPKAKIKF